MLSRQGAEVESWPGGVKRCGCPARLAAQASAEQAGEWRPTQAPKDLTCMLGVLPLALEGREKEGAVVEFPRPAPGPPQHAPGATPGTPRNSRFRPYNRCISNRAARLASSHTLAAPSALLGLHYFASLGPSASWGLRLRLQSWASQSAVAPASKLSPRGLSLRRCRAGRLSVHQLTIGYRSFHF